MSEEAIIVNEPVTVLLSKHGWVKAAKTHEIDIAKMPFKSGDRVELAVKCRTKNQAVFLDNLGRAFSIQCHQLPSARGSGEPLNSWFSLQKDARIVALAAGNPSDQFLLSTSYGYGYICDMEDMLSYKKAGKNQVTVANKARILQPVLLLPNVKHIAAITNMGRLLIFELAHLPKLSRGKGNKIINIPKKYLDSGDECLQHIALMADADQLQINSGKRHMILRALDLEAYRSERGRRGQSLPRGFVKLTASLSFKVQ